MKAKNKNSSFEKQMSELEILIEKLEGESLSLEDSLATFEQAMELGKQCALQLEKAQQRVNCLIQENESGQAEELRDDGNETQ
ncbi:MAG: exodeoxyribonuclease VII small subunit [Desulfarculales bacterium]|jgi:exodeoxyribonuclease VII small subunit|nr:exodeoxyribonuclease VII small subunit [Desulfarculales bacterium]